MPLQNQFPYDIAISFAGEDRTISQKLFELLKARGVNVFYDFNELANLWGEDLIEHLSDVYANQARYCLMLISKYYPDKPWTRLERRNAEARALRQPEAYILPVRLDDTEVPGIPATISYLDLRHLSPEYIADQVVIKLKGASQRNLIPPKSTYTIPMPQIKRTYTQLEKDRFVEQAFAGIRDYFRQALAELKRRHPECETDLKEIHSQKFIAKVYMQGSLRCSCKIWLGSEFGSQMSIDYLEGHNIDINQDSTLNDYLLVDEASGELKLKISPFGIQLQRSDQDIASPQQAAEYLWRRFISPLEARQS